MSERNNAVLIGAKSTGKTALICGLSETAIRYGCSVTFERESDRKHILENIARLRNGKWTVASSPYSYSSIIIKDKQLFGYRSARLLDTGGELYMGANSLLEKLYSSELEKTSLKGRAKQSRAQTNMEFFENLITMSRCKILMLVPSTLFMSRSQIKKYIDSGITIEFDTTRGPELFISYIDYMSFFKTSEIALAITFADLVEFPPPYYLSLDFTNFLRHLQNRGRTTIIPVGIPHEKQGEALVPTHNSNSFQCFGHDKLIDWLLK